MYQFNYSIIIPHYNIPQLLLRCLKSIPVREDIQVIVVDDCSPNSAHYLEVYPELSRPYLEFYQTEIGGSAGRARNVGLDHALGKWLIFADADDFFVEDFSSIIDIHKEDLEDVIYFFSKSVNSDNVEVANDRADYFNDLIFKYLNDDNEGWLRNEHVVPWAKMIKRYLVEENHIRFEQTRYSNDVLFNVSCGCIAKKVKVVQDCIYTVTSRQDSLTIKKNITNSEYICRTEVSIRAQHVICEIGKDNTYAFVSGAMKRLLLENILLFIYFWKKLQIEGFSQNKVFYCLRLHPNRQVRLRLSMAVAASYLIPFFVLKCFVKD